MSTPALSEHSLLVYVKSSVAYRAMLETPTYVGQSELLHADLDTEWHDNDEDGEKPDGLFHTISLGCANYRIFTLGNALDRLQWTKCTRKSRVRLYASLKSLGWDPSTLIQLPDYQL